METIHAMLLFLDPAIIWAFRLSGGPWSGFFLGSALLNLFCVVLGDVSSTLVRRMNRKIYGGYHEAMVHNHNLSVQALRNADKDAYKAVNKQAHEAFGKYFFSQAGAFTLSIWPLPFALAWMDMRFGSIPFTLPFSIPGVGQAVMFQFFFIPVYIALRMVYGRVMRRFAWYRRVQSWASHASDKEMLSFVDLFKPSDGAEERDVR